MRLIYQSVGGGALVLADDRDEYYVVQFIGEVGKKNYQTALREILKNVEDDGYTALLLNLKDLQSQPDLAGYWFWAHFVPRFYKKAGKCKVAIVRAKKTNWRNQLGKITALLRAGKVQVNVHFFDTLPTAQDWLLDGILPEKAPSERKFLPNFSNPFKRKKKQIEEGEDDYERDSWQDEDEAYDDDERPQKRSFLLKALDWIKEKATFFSFLKKIKVKVKFDPKGGLKEEE